MVFEWDDNKNKINKQIHGIDFELASRVFADPNRIEKYDYKHSTEEDRYITIGEINGTTYVVMVVYTDRKETIRMISARHATDAERKEYYDRSQRD